MRQPHKFDARVIGDLQRKLCEDLLDKVFANADLLMSFGVPPGSGVSLGLGALLSAALAIGQKLAAHHGEIKDEKVAQKAGMAIVCFILRGHEEDDPVSAGNVAKVREELVALGATTLLDNLEFLEVGR